MSNELLEKRRERAALYQKARHLLDLVAERDNIMTDDEQADFDTMQEQLETLDADIKRRSALSKYDAELVGPGDPGDSKIGMNETEIRQYSIVRAIEAMGAARRGDRDPWRNAGLELEASAAVARQVGVAAQGFYVPTDVTMSEQRDLSVGTATAGGHMVSTDLLAQSFIDILTNKMVLRAAGMTLLTGLVGDVAIPRKTARATAYWVGEGGTVTESQQAVDQVALTPHTVGAFTDYSRKLTKQSSISVEQFVREDLATVLQLAIDYAGLHGDSGTVTNQPDGVAATSGIGSVVGGTNGLAPTWAHIVSLETEVAQDNADIGRTAYITNAKVRGKLKSTVKESGDANYVWNDAATLNGYTTFVTNQVASDLDKGTSTGVCSAIFFGNWADLVLGMWGGLDILVDPYTHSTSGTMRVVALQDVDFAVRHAQSFAAMLDALTA